MLFKKIMRFPLSRKMKVGLGNALSPFIPIVKNRIAFVTKARIPFGGNLRCLADELITHGAKDVVIYCDGPINPETKAILQSNGAVVSSGFSLTNLRLLLSSETIFVGHSIRDAHIGSAKVGRTVVNLWHGVPLKRIEMLMPELAQSDPQRFELMKANAQLYDYVIASNANDETVMSQAFGVGTNKIIRSGLPRFDYMNDDYQLPSDLNKQQHRFLEEADGRRVILYSPTFRENSKSPFTQINEEVAEKMTAFAHKNKYVFAIRSHPYDLQSAKKLFRKDHVNFIDASSTHYPEVGVILRNTDILITDYSSIWVDYLLRKKPILGLMPDLAEYTSTERGFIHNLDEVFPGPMFNNWQQLLTSLQPSLSDNGLSKDTNPLFPETRNKATRLLLPENTAESISYSRKLAKMLNFA